MTVRRIWSKRIPLIALQTNYPLTRDQAEVIRKEWDDLIRQGKTPVLSHDMTVIHLVPPLAPWLALASFMCSLGIVVWVMFR
jgi:hypothetical protein